MTRSTTSILTILLLIIGTCRSFTAPALISKKSITRSPPARSVPPISFDVSNMNDLQPWRLYAENADSPPPSSKKENKLPFWLDPGTKGGAVFLTVALFVLPILFYAFITSVFGVDEIEAGKWIGVGFTFLVSLAWISTYLFRVATKDMTYAKQLKDYENAVIAKRLEELDEDEVQALVEEVERDDF